MPLHLIPLDAWDPLRKVKADLAKAAPKNMLKLLAANRQSVFQAVPHGTSFPLALQGTHFSAGGHGMAVLSLD